MKLFEIEKARMESAGTHSHAYPGQSIESMDIDQLSMRLESLSNDYAMLQASKDESMARPRVIAIENRYGLVSLEKDLSLRTEGLGSWISSMIQKVLDAISRFFDWIFGTGGTKESADKAVERAEETIKGTEKVREKKKKEVSASSKEKNDSDFDAYPVSLAFLKPHFILGETNTHNGGLTYSGKNANELLSSLEGVRESISRANSVIRLLPSTSMLHSGEHLISLIKHINEAKGTPKVETDGKIIASLKIDDFIYIAFDLRPRNEKIAFVKSYAKSDLQQPDVSAPFTVYDVSNNILPYMVSIGKSYSDLIAKAKTSFEKSEKEYITLLKDVDESYDRGLAVKMRLTLAMMSVVRDFSWIPKMIDDTASALQRATKKRQEHH